MVDQCECGKVLRRGCSYNLCATCCRVEEERDPPCALHKKYKHQLPRRESKEADLGEHSAEEKESPPSALELSAPAVNPAANSGSDMVTMLKSLLQPMTDRLAALEAASAPAPSARPATEAKEVLDVTQDNAFFSALAQVANGSPPATDPETLALAPADAPRRSNKSKKAKRKQVNISPVVSASAPVVLSPASELDSDSSEDSDDEVVVIGGTITDAVRKEVKRYVAEHGSLMAYVRSREFNVLRNRHECVYLARLWPYMRDSDQQEFVARRFVGLILGDINNNFDAMHAFFGDDDVTLSQSLLTKLVKHSSAFAKYNKKAQEFAAPKPNPSNKRHPRNRGKHGKRGHASKK